MLQKVAVVEDITAEEMNNLLFQLRWDLEEVSAELMRNMYTKLPMDLHYEGDIYRGFELRDSDILNFLNNKFFYTEDRREYAEVESWTVDFDYAVSLAVGGKRMGVVIKSNTKRHEVVMSVLPDVVRELKSSPYYDSLLDVLSFESQVMVRNPGKVKYGLCTDIVRLVTAAELYRINNGYTAEVESLYSLLGEGDVQLLQGAVKGYDQQVFGCQDLESLCFLEGVG